MGSRKRNIKKGSVTHRDSLRMIVRKGQNLEKNANILFPCEICERFFKSEFEAVKHWQRCKSQCLKGKISNKSNEKLDQQKKGINNNYIENHDTKKCERNVRSLRSNVNKRMEICNNYISVPKKKSIKDIRTDVQLNNTVNKESPAVHSDNLVKNNGEGNRILKTSESPGVEEKVKPIRGGKRLTEEQIAERLRIISVKLRKKVEVKVCPEDEEEEERREIEDRLMALNQDSEVSYFNDYSEFDDKLKDEDMDELESKNPIGTNMTENSRNSKPTLLNGFGHSNSSEHPNGTIIITQSPDGQLHGCVSCPEVFMSALELLRHKREKHTVPKIIMAPEEVKKFYDYPDRSHCPICKRVFVITKKSMFIKHLQTHTYVGEYECSICKKKFKRQDHMRMHKKRHIITSYI